MGADSIASRLLDVMEGEILPMTERSVAAGNKVFGAAILRKSVMSASSRERTAKPSIRCCTARSAHSTSSTRCPTRDLTFLSTHEPCPLCLSALTWAHDLRILKEVFGVEDGEYRASNAYWTSHSIPEHQLRASALRPVSALQGRQRYSVQLTAFADGWTAERSLRFDCAISYPTRLSDSSGRCNT
jgi:tRNA(Arg) A34 adenosine deaminase TadA